MTNDQQLLDAYARERSESAFGELVIRHIDFVYSAALRVVNGDSLGVGPKKRTLLRRRTRNAFSERLFVPFRRERGLIGKQYAHDDR